MCRWLQMLPVHCVPQPESLYSNRIQPTLYVPQPESADHAQRTGETTQVQNIRSQSLVACNYNMEVKMRKCLLALRLCGILAIQNDLEEKAITEHYVTVNQCL